MIDKRVIENPHVRHHGPGVATGHFIVQRLTGALNIAFLLFFAWFVVRLAGADRAQMIDTVRNPLVAIVLALLIVNVCIHMRIGMREIIADYLDEDRTNRLGLLANDLFVGAIALVALVSIAKLVFWG